MGFKQKLYRKMRALNTFERWFYLWALMASYGWSTTSNAKENQDTLNFCVLTDTHLDGDYRAGSSPTQNCHNSFNSSGNSTAGYYGDYECEAPIALLESTLDAMQDFHPDPDFILWLGDSYRHKKFDEVNKSSEVHKKINLTLDMISRRFDDTPVFPAIGNHDNVPPELMPVNDSNFYRMYLTHSRWEKLLPTAAMQETFIKGGYYSTIIRPGLKLVILNTILWLNVNNLTEHLDDPAQQMQWFSEELKQSHDTKEKVLLAAHSPPGYFERDIDRFELTPYLNAKFNDQFFGLIVKYSDVITCQLYTHTHSNSFRLFVDRGKPISGAITTASISPLFGVNPSFKYFSINSASCQLEKYVLYAMNLTDANILYELNKTKSVKKLWKIISDTSLLDYGLHLQNLSVNSLVKFYNKLLSDDETFDTYVLSNKGGAFGYFTSLDYVTNACAIKFIKTKDFENCFNSLRDELNRTVIYEKLKIY